jgi:exosortase A-associated hydrolase 1
MRRLIDFACEGASCAATLDEAPGTSGLLIVSGGNEIRTGAHRGMARLAQDVANAGSPVFRFDRRGIGDSDGENQGFLSSGSDIAAAWAAFRAAAPHISRVVAFGNCDAATAILLHRESCNAQMLVLANPWIVEPNDDLPPAAAIKDRYTRRLRDPAAWKALIMGKIDLAAAIRGLARIIRKPSNPADLATAFAQALAACPVPVHILLASGDGTALAFVDAWKSEAFSSVKARSDVTVESLDSTSHSFATDRDYAALKATLLRALAG